MKKTRHQILEERVNSIGLNSEEWTELKSFRTESLLKRGLNPAEFSIDSRICKKGW